MNGQSFFYFLSTDCILINIVFAKNQTKQVSLKKQLNTFKYIVLTPAVIAGIACIPREQQN